VTVSRGLVLKICGVEKIRRYVKNSSRTSFVAGENAMPMVFRTRAEMMWSAKVIAKIIVG
jgi:hypothetical protein